MLADACHELDVLAVEENSGQGRAGTTFGQYQEAFRRKAELQKKIDYYEAVIRTGSQMITHIMMNMPDIEQNHAVIQKCRESMAQYNHESISLVW